MTLKSPIVITGDNIDLTPALSDYVNQKIEKTLGKLPTAVSHCDVYLTVNKNPKVRKLTHSDTSKPVGIFANALC
jgi:putative sigma-54 modulation protein